MTTKPSLMTLCVVLLSVLIVSDTAFAQQKIDTLWVYDEATFSRMSLNQRIAYAQARIEEANDVMMNSNLSERFELPLVESLQEAPFDSDSGTCSVDVLNFLRDSQWIKARRSVADIVVLVVSEIGSCPFEGETSNDICGGTFNIPKVLGSHRSESHALPF